MQVVVLTTGRTKQRPKKTSLPGAQTFDRLLQQQGDGTLVVDQHARRSVLIQDDVRHSHVLLQRHQNAPAERRINQLIETEEPLFFHLGVTTGMSHNTLQSAVHQWAKA